MPEVNARSKAWKNNNNNNRVRKTTISQQQQQQQGLTYCQPLLLRQRLGASPSLCTAPSTPLDNSSKPTSWHRYNPCILSSPSPRNPSWSSLNLRHSGDEGKLVQIHQWLLYKIDPQQGLPLTRQIEATHLIDLHTCHTPCSAGRKLPFGE